VRIFNSTQTTIIADNGRLADDFKTRLVGLLNRSQITQGEALVISPCQQIHMFFMKFSIDVIFVDRSDMVVGLVENIKPFAMSPIFKNSHRAIELPAGTIAQSHTCMGDAIQFLIG
jgi:uncharacterized membrane protein (UPF0127 family)